MYSVNLVRAYSLPTNRKRVSNKLVPWIIRGELSYLAPLGSENISAPYFKQCFFQGVGGITPQTVKRHASQSQDRNNKYFILYIEFCINNKILPQQETKVKDYGTLPSIKIHI